MRVVRDIPLTCDLRSAEGLAFDFYCGDSSCLSCGFYAKSGPEWFYCDGGFNPGPDGRWNHVVIPKECLRAGRGVDGWGRIDGIRFSFWCDGTNDTTCAVANVSVRPLVDPKVLILRDEEMPSGDSAKYARVFARTLTALGVRYGIVGDKDIGLKDLDGVSIIVLAYNDKLGTNGVRAVQRFIGRGGKVLCGSYQVQAIREAMGFCLKGGGYWPRSQRKPAIQGIRKCGCGLPGQPDFVHSSSWGATPVAPVGEGDAIADWIDENGRDIGLAAVVRVPNGFVFSHVWLGGTEAEGLALVGSMLSALEPSFASSVERSVACARQKAKDATVRIEEARKDSRRRGAWCMTPWGVGNRNWEDSARFLKECGVRFVAPCMANAASSCYHSSVLNERPAVKNDGDALEQCLSACHRHGLECHVWKMNFTFSPSADPDFSRKMEEEGRLQVKSSGDLRRDWLCPSDIRNVRREADAMVEIAKRGADGVQFDFIRYNDGDVCYCPRCRARFEKRMARTIEPWPSAVEKDPELAEAWRVLRCDTISRIVEVISARIRKETPGVRVSAAVFGNTYAAPHLVGQDWIPWCEKGWLDFACPMTYNDDCDAYARSLRAIRKRTSVPLYPGIGVTVWEPNGPAVVADRLARQMRIGRDLGFEGYTVFELDRISTEALLRVPVRVPFR